MDDLWIKAIHITAMVTWIGGMVLSATTLAGLSRQSVPVRFAEEVRRWDRSVTSPAMLLTWAFGLTLALRGGWFGEPWLTVKLALVLVLSMLHGLLSGTLRRATRSSGALSPLFAAVAPLILATVGAIVLLVVVKPF